MTMRERMLAFIRGEEVDRVPFVQYDGIVGPNEEVWDLIGRESMGILRWIRPYELQHPNCHTVDFRTSVSSSSHASPLSLLDFP